MTVAPKGVPGRPDWLQRLSLSDQLEVVVGDRSSGGAPLVSINYRSRSWRAVRVALTLLVLGICVGLFVNGFGDRWVLAGLPVMLVLNRVIASQRTKMLLTDEVLGQAAARAAEALGRETSRHHWVIEGQMAAVLGSEFTRLHNWWTVPGRVAYGDRAREEALLAAASPELRAFMRPALQAPEPDDAEAVSHEPGQPWPVLPADPQTWPTMPGGDPS